MRILLVSDIHANLTALDAVIRDAGAFDKIWCLGDTVGYGPQPNECIRRLREFDIVALAGNHDLAVVGKTSLWEFSELAKEAIFWTRHLLADENRDWLSSLPSTPLVTHHRARRSQRQSSFYRNAHLSQRSFAHAGYLSQAMGWIKSP